MNAEQLKQMSDSDLGEVLRLAEAELRARTERRRLDAIAQIKEIASTAGVAVSINGHRGRPPGRRPTRSRSTRTKTAAAK